MAWTDSRIFRQYVADIMDNTTAMDWVTDASVKAALYNNTITPDNDVTAANSAYNVGQWALAQEVIDTSGGGTDWPAGGVNLAGRTINVATADVVMADATTDTASGATADITNAFGCLVYDDTITTPVADQGFCYNYFGGANSVTAGTFTVVWSANGVFRFTL